MDQTYVERTSGTDRHAAEWRSSFVFVLLPQTLLVLLSVEGRDGFAPHMSSLDSYMLWVFPMAGLRLQCARYEETILSTITDSTVTYHKLRVILKLDCFWTFSRDLVAVFVNTKANALASVWLHNRVEKHQKLVPRHKSAHETRPDFLRF
jgi:hypothetical protein